MKKAELRRQLESEFCGGFFEKPLRHMIRFAKVLPDEQIVSSLMRQLAWTHFTKIIYIDDPFKRNKYRKSWDPYFNTGSNTDPLGDKN